MYPTLDKGFDLYLFSLNFHAMQRDQKELIVLAPSQKTRGGRGNPDQLLRWIA